MRQRLVAGLLAAVLVAGASALAVIAAGNDGDDGPRPLPVLGAGGAGAERTAAVAEDAAQSLIHPGHVTYEIGELAAIDGDAAAWRVGVDGNVEERMRRLADALGLSGQIERSEHGWLLVDGDRRLEVQEQPGLPWHLGAEEPDGVVTSEVAVECAPDDECAEVVEPEPVEPVPVEPVRPADLPSRDEAETIARKVFDAAGVAAGDVRVDDLETVWGITTEPVLGGLPTVGYGTYLSVGSAGAVQWANGWLAVPTEADSYPLVGTDAAVGRLEEQGGGYIGILGAPEPAIAETLPAVEECPPEADCIDHEPLPEPLPEPEPIIVRVTGVRLGLMFVPAFETAEAWFVPAYLFELDGGAGGEAPVTGIPGEYLVEPVFVR